MSSKRWEEGVGMNEPKEEKLTPTESDLMKQVLRNALAELNSFKRKYARYKEFAKVISAIDECTINLTATDELERMLQHDQ